MGVRGGGGVDEEVVGDVGTVALFDTSQKAARGTCT